MSDTPRKEDIKSLAILQVGIYKYQLSKLKE